MKNFILRLLNLAAIQAVAIVACVDISARTDNNVYIVDGTETWRLTAPRGESGACVKNTIDHTYEATRYRESIQPFTIYNERLRLDKASGKGSAKYRNATSDNVFHDDNRVCYFDINLDGPGKKSKVHFERTLSDPAFFTKLYLADEYPIRHKEVRIVIPAEYPAITVEELNFQSADDSSISRHIETSADGARTYVYTLTDIDGTRQQEDENGSPHPMLYQPVLLVKGWFESTDSLYRWHTGMSHTDTDIPDVDNFIAHEIYGQQSLELTRPQRLEKIYRWVQSNIRYLAYEEGERGHRPERPAEVIRKRMGDCKDMALLLATLLNHEGIEASTAVVGTDDIPFTIAQNGTLAATNHSICIATVGSDTLYLDATNEYIPYTHIPGAIQGKDAIVLPHDGSECRLTVIPTLPAAITATDSVSYQYMLSPGHDALTGTVTRTLSGDFKEQYLTGYASKGEKYAVENMAIDLVPGRRSNIPEDQLSINLNATGGTATIEAPITNHEGVTDAGPMVYLDLNSRNGVAFDRIDNHDRQTPYRFPFRGRIVRHTRVVLPDDAVVTYLPDNYTASLPQAALCCSFSNPEPGVVEMIKAIEINNPMIPVKDIDQWNRTISAWNNACKGQIELSFE